MILTAIALLEIIFSCIAIIGAIFLGMIIGLHLYNKKEIEKFEHEQNQVEIPENIHKARQESGK